MSTEYELTTRKHELYTKNQKRWTFLYNSFLGGDDYKSAGYLTRYVNETDAEYSARCQETPVDNHVQSVVQIYNSFIFRQEIQREFGSLQALPELQQFLEDADLEGRSFDAFMRELNSWAQVFGHAWAIVVKPDVQAQTRRDELDQGVRPYCALLTPLAVTDWAFEREPNGRYSLSYLKYIEDVNGSTEVYREWTPETITVSTVDHDNEELLEKEIVPNPLGYVPAVICYSERSIVRGIGVSSVGDIADQQRYIFNALSESAQSIRLDSHPSLVVTPDTQVGTGAGSIITVPENMDPGLKPYVLDFAGASIDAIYKVIDYSVQSIEKMAHIGGVRATQSQAMSGVALETEFQLLNARLSSQARNLELAEEGIWRIFATYQKQPFDVTVEYPVEFGRDAEPDRIES